METLVCQRRSMPMAGEALGGTEKDGGKSAIIVCIAIRMASLNSLMQPLKI